MHRVAARLREHHEPLLITALATLRFDKHFSLFAFVSTGLCEWTFS